MTLSSKKVAVVAIGLALVFAAAEAMAQPPGGGRFGGGRRGRGGFGRGGAISKVDVASNDAVQSALNLSEETQSTISTVQDEYQAALQEARQEAFQGGFDPENAGALQERMAAIEKEYGDKVVAALDEEQAKRLNEIWIQALGSAALLQAEVQTALEVSDEQKTQLTEANDANTEARLALGFQASQEERQAAQEEADAALLAVLTDEQKTEFEQMKGEPFAEVAQLQRGGGRRGRRGGGRFGGRRGGGRRGGGGGGAAEE